MITLLQSSAHIFFLKLYTDFFCKQTSCTQTSVWFSKALFDALTLTQPGSGQIKVKILLKLFNVNIPVSAAVTCVLSSEFVLHVGMLSSLMSDTCFYRKDEVSHHNASSFILLTWCCI